MTMGTELTGKCDAFTLAVGEPAGEREVRGRVTFADDASAQSVTVGLSLLAQLGEKPLGPGRIDADTPIAGCSTTVERGAEDTTFVLPLPPVAAPYLGTTFRIGVGIVAAADDGKTLRILIDVPPAGDDARLVLRGLPSETPLARPERFLTGLWTALLGVALVMLGAQIDAEWAYALGGIATAGGLVFAAFSRAGILGWFLLGSTRLRLEAGDGELLASVRGGSRVAGGRVRLVAVEYEIHEGARFEHREITARDARLARADSGSWVARVPLPAAIEAPPSLGLRAPNRLLSIRWLAKIELETAAGRVTRSSIPVHVGIEQKHANDDPREQTE
jgi:hypothetical protein